MVNLGEAGEQARREAKKTAMWGEVHGKESMVESSRSGESRSDTVERGRLNNQLETTPDPPQLVYPDRLWVD